MCISFQTICKYGTQLTDVLITGRILFIFRCYTILPVVLKMLGSNGTDYIAIGYKCEPGIQCVVILSLQRTSHIKRYMHALLFTTSYIVVLCNLTLLLFTKSHIVMQPHTQLIIETTICLSTTLKHMEMSAEIKA